MARGGRAESGTTVLVFLRPIRCRLRQLEAVLKRYAKFRAREGPQIKIKAVPAKLVLSRCATGVSEFRGRGCGAGKKCPRPSKPRARPRRMLGGEKRGKLRAVARLDGERR
jgi:hypothetical protein